MKEPRITIHEVSLQAVNKCPIGKPAGHDLFLGSGNLHRPVAKQLDKPRWLKSGLVELRGVATLDEVEGEQQALGVVSFPSKLGNTVRRLFLGEEKPLGYLALESWPKSDDSLKATE